MEKNDIIKGKWNKNIYWIENFIEKGGIGYIYKVVDDKERVFVLKASKDLMSLTKEYKILKEFSYLSAIPRVYELDDGYIQGEENHFIIMEYIKGESLKKYLLRTISIKDILSVAIIIGEILKEIYSKGYIYWDVKLENILIDKKNMMIKIIDFGGVSKIGQSIKEYTPTYNMHCWRDRPHYDDKSLTFSINMIIISLLYKKEYNPLTNSIEDILYRIKDSNLASNIKKVLINGMIGNYDIREYTGRLKDIIREGKFEENKHCRNWIDTFFWGSIGIFLIFIFFTFNK
ncbi:protein kinase [Clostridium sp. D2Q-14]|uniref:protein kinase domain-containing protein n=1 Tax=Anaeromonas gelatinilytica TaxID=2683194 RepID=UPI00193BA32C|nr:protein kinase [Anaeromonas gelatinilytica]MBS4534694.1 protein kinase [Anaeromonas gelatinilytica]